MRHTHLVNYALYQAGWFACVLGAAWNYPLTGLAIATVAVAIHVALATQRTIELRLLAIATVVGLGVELVQLGAGTYRFASGTVIDRIPPPWLLALWAQLATTFRYSLHYVFARWLPSLLFGAIGAPLAFLAGERLGAVTFLPSVTIALLRLSLCWGVAALVFHFAVRSSSGSVPSAGAQLYRA
ncbi:MAG: DUF2878 domain-containing protein [Vicinamibacterales bacterium]